MNTPMETPRAVDIRKVISGRSWNSDHTRWAPLYSYYVLESDYRSLERSLIEHKALVRECDEMLRECRQDLLENPGYEGVVDMVDALLARLKEALAGEGGET